MAAITLKIEQLVLDNDNPRITHSKGQQQALQKVVKDQRTKLVRLAESVVDKGLSPIEKLMVLEPIQKVVESWESFVIFCVAPERCRGVPHVDA